MPELPEVETTLTGLRAPLLGATIARLVVRERRLRWRISADMETKIRGRFVVDMQRRGKYLLITLDRGGLLMHLGMSGSFRVVTKSAPVQPHDHYDLVTARGDVVRYRDPRRFGCLLWTRGAPSEDARICRLGVEPLSAKFNGAHLHACATRRTLAVKNFLMDGRVVVGVGNIYASEALFDAGINPARACNRISVMRYQRLARSVKKILRAAIRQGGTTIRDFSNADGHPGYFEQALLVYGRAGERCRHCTARIRQQTIGQRSTFYCPRCQR